MSNQEHAEAAQAIKSSRKRRRPSKAYTKSMKILRRLHMYAGLILMPLVLLYGVTGILFNHPQLFAELEIEEYGEELAEENGLAALPSAPDLAAKVIAKMNGGGVAGVESTFTLADDLEMKYRRELIVDMDEGSDIHRVVYDLEHREGYTRVFHREEPEKSDRAPFHQSKGFKVDSEDAKIAAESSRKLIEARGGKPEGKERVRILPAVSFHATDAEGKLWLITYDPQRGTLSGQDPSEPLKDVDFRSYLTQLHLTHGYPSRYDGIRTIWAVLVDIVSALMVFWALSGFLMWFQMKNVRFYGLIALMVSLAAAAAAFWLMWQNMTTL